MKRVEVISMLPVNCFEENVFLSDTAQHIVNDDKSVLASSVQTALGRILASPEFCKAQRTSRLLRFLVEKALIGAVNETNEYAIGIEVFDRSPSTYDTCHDPIVRVQIGRLREKLKAYYLLNSAHIEVMFTIPVGSYMPLIEKVNVESGSPSRDYLLSVSPLLHLSQISQGASFTHGLNEELIFQLFKEFGQKIVSQPLSGGHCVTPPGTLHLVEGSIRIHGELLRVSLRLIDAASGAVLWSEQFDRCAVFSIVVQDELAATICRALKYYFFSLNSKRLVQLSAT